MNEKHIDWQMIGKKIDEGFARMGFTHDAYLRKQAIDRTISDTVDMFCKHLERERRTAVEEVLKRVGEKAREMREDGPADMRDMIWFLDAELKRLEEK